MSKLKYFYSACSATKILILILLSLNLTACYDSMYMNEPTQSVNRTYGFYEFYDNPHSYYDDYYSGYNRPRSRNHYNNHQIHQHVYSHQNYNHYHYPPFERENNARGYNNGYDAGIQAGRRRHQVQARQEQINSDRALAQRLQNEEVANAQRAAQIASDRALAERLQAQEYANVR